MFYSLELRWIFCLKAVSDLIWKIVASKFCLLTTETVFLVWNMPQSWKCQTLHVASWCKFNDVIVTINSLILAQNDFWNYLFQWDLVFFEGYRKIQSKGGNYIIIKYVWWRYRRVSLFEFFPPYNTFCWPKPKLYTVRPWDARFLGNEKTRVALIRATWVDCLVCFEEDLRQNILTDFASINWLTVSFQISICLITWN